MDGLNWQSLLARETIQLERQPPDTVLLWQDKRPLIFLRESKAGAASCSSTSIPRLSNAENNRPSSSCCTASPNPSAPPRSLPFPPTLKPASRSHHRRARTFRSPSPPPISHGNPSSTPTPPLTPRPHPVFSPSARATSHFSPPPSISAIRARRTSPPAARPIPDTAANRHHRAPHPPGSAVARLVARADRGAAGFMEIHRTANSATP